MAESYIRKFFLLPAAALFFVSPSYASVMAGGAYVLDLASMNNGSENTFSTSYKIETGTIGQGIFGRGSSENYATDGGFVQQTVTLATPPFDDLSDAYVYPNPYKPNSAGLFQDDRITFKHLPEHAEIKIFEITGRQAARLTKTDPSVDYLEWNVTNSDGSRLASGVYIFYVTSPGRGTARGKFAVIR